jgi:hypothetical protein
MRFDRPWATVLLRGSASAYLAAIWLSGTGSTLPSHLLPRAANYFVQVAALFPLAATDSIEYRAEAWVCAHHAWEELATDAYFPLDAGNKENRFQRVMHFYRENEPTMRALDKYLIDAHGKGRHADGIPLELAIGGVRMCSLRIPIPKPGDTLVPFQHLPLSEYPANERHYFYHTPKSTLARRCSGGGDE